MSFDVTVNFWVVLVSAVASMVIGSIWYGPLFGKMFMSAMGMDQWTPEKQAAMKKSMALSYVLQFIASLVMFFVLAWMMSVIATPSFQTGLFMGFVVWIGFVVPLKLGETIWGGKWNLFWIGISHMLVTLLVAGAIIGAWH